MNSPETGASIVRTMYYLPIVCARRSIYTANPYFIPDAAACETLIEARRRGVNVRNSVRLFGPLLAVVAMPTNSSQRRSSGDITVTVWRAVERSCPATPSSRVVTT